MNFETQLYRGISLLSLVLQNGFGYKNTQNCLNNVCYNYNFALFS